jgi:hypothetical protein
MSTHSEVICKSYIQSAHKKALVFRLDIWRTSVPSQVIILVGVRSRYDLGGARVFPCVKVSKSRRTRSFWRTKSEMTIAFLCLIGKSENLDRPGSIRGFTGSLGRRHILKRMENPPEGVIILKSPIWIPVLLWGVFRRYRYFFGVEFPDFMKKSERIRVV